MSRFYTTAVGTGRLRSAASEAFTSMNRLGAQGRAFLFLLDYALASPLVLPLDELPRYGIRYSFPNGTSDPPAARTLRTITPTPGVPASYDPIVGLSPPTRAEYGAAFELVQTEQRAGNSYLCNLTAAVPLELSCSLEDVYDLAHAKFRLLWPGRFVVFSPEPFVRIQGTTISSYPMKGTIDAELPNAAERILADEKESAEHTTIVDLIRNDIGRVACRVRVPRYRYIEEIAGARARILTVSSCIEGELGPGWRGRLGDIFSELLPAGSVTGAPKDSTCRVIARAENYQRGFYSGVAGLYDGECLESGVLIRFIEQQGAGYLFKTGGGITIHSTAELEYAELIQKINVPLS